MAEQSKQMSRHISTRLQCIIPQRRGVAYHDGTCFLFAGLCMRGEEAIAENGIRDPALGKLFHGKTTELRL
jgi:hypothetical protein